VNKSLGLIEIRDSPIPLVNVLISVPTSESSITVYCKLYLVPDPGAGVWVKPYLQMEAKPILVKSGPLKGAVSDIHWKGDVLMELRQDVSLKEILMKLEQDIKVIWQPRYSCWAIHPPHDPHGRSFPSREQWGCYETIASHLLKVSHGWRTERPMDDKVYDVCPRCSSSNINKAIKRLPKSQQEIEALGFKAEWDCLCFDCQFEWLEREKP